MRRHIFKADAWSGPSRAASDQAPELTLLFDGETDKVVVNARRRYRASRPDEDDARRPFAARLLGSEGSGGTVLRSSPNETGRTEIAGQTLDSQHQAFRFGHASRSAVEEKRDVANERGASHDDHGSDRECGENLYQGEAITSDTRPFLLHLHGSGLPSRIVSAVMT
ncbi:MAG TPA: hypothetical protein VMT08_40930 [Bradyrhizobium sp.]|nr:hypothetical protein [Bradyrhizobium sp.]